MILVLGDSNYRDTLHQYGQALNDSVSEEIKFEFINSNESLKASLAAREDNPKIIIIGSPLNEIALKVRSDKKKGRDETVRLVVEEQINIVEESSAKLSNTLHLVMPPFMRQDPAWIEK